MAVSQTLGSVQATGGRGPRPDDSLSRKKRGRYSPTNKKVGML